MAQSKVHRVQRTVIIGAGAMGLAVIQAFRRRLVERWGELPTVACLAVVGKAGGAPDNSLPTVSLPVRAESATRPEAQEALRAAGPAVITPLVEALTRVSRISQREPFQLRGWSAKWSGEVAFYVVAALDDPLGGGVFLDLAYLARHLASQRLNAPAGLTGLLLLPDALNPDDPRPALARAYAALRELDAWMGLHNGYTAQWGDGLRVQGWGPAFDRGCYLLEALNAEGLGLEEPGERVEFAAEALLQLAVTPLGAGCESPLTPLWSMGERPHDYGALGLAAWVYPGRALAERLARRLAGEILSAWLDGTEGRGERGEERLTFSNSNFHLDAAEALLPAELLREAGLWRPLRSRLSLMRAKRFRQDLEDEAAERLECLAARRPDLDRRAEALAGELSERLARAVAQRLDLAAPGRLAEVEAFLTEVEQHLARLRAQTEQAADAHWKDLEALDVQLERVGGEMDALAARFPEPNWRAALAILRSPRRLLGLILAYRDLARAGAAYGALLARQMAVATEVLRRDLVVEAYEGALKGVQDQRTQVASLAEAIRAAQESLAPGSETRRQGGMPKSPLAPLSVYGSLGFGLERSILTPESVEALYASVCGDHSTGSPRRSLSRAVTTQAVIASKAKQSPSRKEEIASSPKTLLAMTRAEQLPRAKPRGSGQALADPSASPSTSLRAGLRTSLLADIARAQGPLSAWLEMEPDGQAIATACLDYTRRRCQVLDQITVDELLIKSLGDARGRTEALRGLVELASPFLGWDETRLRGAEHQVLRTCTTLGLGDGVASPLLEGLGDLTWAQVVATGEGQRVTALTVVRGLPLAALAGLEEYAAAYRAADPASLHVDSDWADLPDPAT
ncbi:MAG: tubulin-like doman-containing protein [Anaerolineae bacterium]